MTSESVADLVQTLGDLQLLQPAQLKECTRILRLNPSGPRALAKELVQRGWLTVYQVRELFQGRAGDLVLGRYLLLQPLGEGGMGRVFKARHRELNRLVAVKILREERLAKPDAVRRFYREIQAAAQLSHPNIALVYDANRVGKKFFFVMEYLDGIDLHQLVKQSGPLPAALACDYIRQAALGLQHAFERGLVHRDIKPANLLVSLLRSAAGKTAGKESASEPSPGTAAPLAADTLPGQVVKILDLGLACWNWAGESDTSNTLLTQEGMVLGTVDYIAPEQAKDSHHVDIRADLYSLGCTFYYLLTARPPFPEGSTVEKLLKHQTEDPVAVRFLRPDLPFEVSIVVEKLLLKRPEDRYQTPADLAHDLLLAINAANASPSSARIKSTFDLHGLNYTGPAAGFDREASLSATPVTPDTMPSLGSWADLVPMSSRIDSAASGRQTQKPWKKEQLWLGAVLALLFLVGLILLLAIPADQRVSPDPGAHRPKLKKSPEIRRLEPRSGMLKTPFASIVSPSYLISKPFGR